MYYVEALFASKRLLCFTLILLAMAAAFTYVVTFPPVGMRIHNVGQDIQFDPILIGASFAALIMASMLAGTLNRDQSHLAYLWTRPVSRVSIALSYMLVDIATIVLSYGVVLAIGAMVFAVPPQNHLIFDSQTAGIVVHSIALPLMAYALIEVGTSWNPQRQGAAVGIFWASAWVSLILSEILPSSLAQFFRIVNLFNPIAYMTDIHGHGVNVAAGPEQSHIFALTFTAQTILAYAIFVVACAVAIYNWKRMEA
jgi:hypothetical protein